jgi:hypothetical protein
VTSFTFLSKEKNRRTLHRRVLFQDPALSRRFAVHLILRCDPDLIGGASKDAGPNASAYILRGPLHGHLRMRIEDKLARSRGAFASEF